MRPFHPQSVPLVCQHGFVTDHQNWQPPAGQQPPAPQFGQYAAPGSVPPLPAGQGAPYGWAPPPKPGLIPLRPLAFGTLLWAPFQVLRRNPKATFGSALLVQSAVMVLTLIVMGLVTFFSLSRLESAPLEERDAVEAGATLTIVLAAAIPVALSVVASALLQGVIVIEVSRATLGEKLKLGALWRAAGRRLWWLVLWTVLLGLALLIAVAVVAAIVAVLVLAGGDWVVLAVVTGIVGALGIAAVSVWLYTKTSLVPSLIVLERLPIRRAVARSWSLTNGYFWRTFGVQFLVAAIVNILAQIVTTPLSLVFGVAVSLVDPNAAFDAYVPSIILYVLILFVSLVLGAVASVVQSAATALIYIDLRMRKEGLDLELAHFVESAQSGRTAVADPYLPSGVSAGPASFPDQGSPWA
ncbi:MAG: hypothetical protein JWQ59_606 [Cryobacterium sp.]|jgi:hypothetical protein|nr:hypothetical protein [Cryobacterium sp.]